jgi:hypothetical protein
VLPNLNPVSTPCFRYHLSAGWCDLLTADASNFWILLKKEHVENMKKYMGKNLIFSNREGYCGMALKSPYFYADFKEEN